jgi:hypothetical protein
MAPPVTPFWVRFFYGLAATLVAVCLVIALRLIENFNARGIGFAVLGFCLVPACVLGYLAWRYDNGLRTRYDRHLEGLCLECGYDLLLSRQRCPECGTPVLPAQRYPQLATFLTLHYSAAQVDGRLPGVIAAPSAWAFDRVRVAQELRRFLAEDYDEEATARILALDFACHVRPEAVGLTAKQWLYQLHATLTAVDATASSTKPRRPAGR